MIHRVDTKTNTRRRRQRAAMAIAVAGAALPQLARGQSTTWLTAANGTFNVAANWSNGVPGVGTAAVFSAPTTPYTVSFTNSPSSGTLVVANGNLTLALNGNTYSPGGSVQVGTVSTQTGRLTVNNGTLSSGTASIGGTGANGFVTVGAAGAWSSSSSVTIGNGGFGDLTLSSGGRATCTNATLANTSTSVANVTVTGSGSNWTSSGNVNVGLGGPASVNVLSGGTGQCNTIQLGVSAGSAGSMSLSGAGTTWTATRLSNVGADGSGYLEVRDGAVFTATGNSTSLAGDVASSAQVVVSGSGATLNLMSLGMGNGGNASVVVRNGAALNLDTNLGLGPNATFTLDGASLSMNQVIASGGSMTFISGSITLNGPSTTLSGSDLTALFGPTHRIARGQTVTTTNGLTTLTSPATLDGGVLTVPSLANNTPLAIASGTLNLNNGTLFVNPTGPLGNVLSLPTDATANAVTGVNVASGGLVSISGGRLTTGGTFSNSGEVALQSNLSQVDALRLVNTGLVHGTGRVNAIMDNRSGGELRVENGERLVLNTAAVAPVNAGKVSLLGGTLEAAQLLTNTNTGSISGRGTIVASGGISNSGTIALSAGVSDVMGGTVTNLSASKVIVTGGSTSTFYGAVTNNAGSEFRVSANSTAVFLGNVTGLAAFTGPGTKDFESGAAGVAINSGSGTTYVGPAGDLTATFVRDGSMSVEGRASIVPNGGGATSVSRVGSLSIETAGVLDLNDNDLIVTATPKASVESQVARARAGGAWDQPGLTSTFARAHPAHATGLGVLSGQEYLGTGQSQFDGFGVTATDVLVKYTWNGDANFDGRVTFDDYVKIDTGFNTHLTGWLNGDFNYDGVVNFDDYVLIDIAFNQQNGTLSRAIDWISGDDRSGSGPKATGVEAVIGHFAQFGPGYGAAFLAAVPEPSIAALGLALASNSLRRRARRG